MTQTTLKTQNIQEVVSLRCAEARLITHHSHGLYVQPWHMCLPVLHKWLDLQCAEINEDRRSYRYRFTITLNYCAGTSGHLQDPERLQQKCSPIPTPILKIKWSLIKILEYCSAVQVSQENCCLASIQKTTLLQYL